MNQVAPCP